MKGCCPKCHKSYDDVMYTEHHILPKRLFRGSWDVISICRGCHDLLEKEIPFSEKLPVSTYYLIVNNFLGYHAVTPPDQRKQLRPNHLVHH